MPLEHQTHTFLQTHQALYEGIDLPHVNGTRRIQKNNDVFDNDANTKAAQQGAMFGLSEQKIVAHLEEKVLNYGLNSSVPPAVQSHITIVYGK